MRCCLNCKWVGCRNYGHDRSACNKYIEDTEYLKAIRIKLDKIMESEVSENE